MSSWSIFPSCRWRTRAASTPLASIEVSCSLLKRRVDGTDQGTRDLLDKIIAEVRRLNRTITSSLEFVRPLSLTLAPASLEAVLDEAITVATGRRGRPGIAIERIYRAPPEPMLMDRAQLRQVYENLLLNALEAMGESGRVVLECTTAPAPVSATTPYRPAGARDSDPWQGFDRYAVVRITGTGSGIGEEHRARICEFGE